MRVPAFLKNWTGVGTQGVADTFARYRGNAQTHTDLSTLLANQNLAHLRPATAAAALTAGNWKLTVVIQLFHDATQLAIAGRGGHVSMAIWNLATAQSLSFHMVRGSTPPVFGGSLYPFETLLVYHILKRRYPNPAPVIALGPRAHMSSTNTGQDVWFYTCAVTNAQAELMRARMAHHLGQAHTYRYNAVTGLAKNGYWTCLTIVDDILKAARLSTRWGSIATPWAYSYTFANWDCSLAAGQLMPHLLPFEQTGTHPNRGVRRFVGWNPYALHWNDITTSPNSITETWDFDQRRAYFTHNPPIQMAYDY